MASEKLLRLQRRLKEHDEAETAVLASQEYRLGSRSQKRALLSDIQRGIKDLENQIAIQERIDSGKGRMRVMRVVPRDL